MIFSRSHIPQDTSLPLCILSFVHIVNMFATFVPHFILLYDVFRWIGITGKYSNTLCICAKKCIMKQGITESRTQITFCSK